MSEKNREINAGQIYRHFKGNLYKVIGIATDSETEEKVVVYEAQYKRALCPSLFNVSRKTRHRKISK